MLYTFKNKMLRIKREGSELSIFRDEKLILTCPYQVALELARALIRQAKLAEEEQLAGQIIDDQALLLRAGVPILLTGNSHILKEARKEAVYNSQLRRYLPSIHSTEKFSIPRIINTPPQEGDKNGNI